MVYLLIWGGERKSITPGRAFCRRARGRVRLARRGTGIAIVVIVAVVDLRHHLWGDARCAPRSAVSPREHLSPVIGDAQWRGEARGDFRLVRLLPVLEQSPECRARGAHQLVHFLLLLLLLP